MPSSTDRDADCVAALKRMEGCGDDVLRCRLHLMALRGEEVSAMRIRKGSQWPIDFDAAQWRHATPGSLIAAAAICSKRA
jgi:hypothetical protein